jgi:hypothetical protein
MISRTFFAFICSSAAAFFGAGERVEANDLQPGNSARANAQCAAFGPGFTAVDGADTCVWVGGHVRLEVGSRMASAPNNGWAAGAATPAAVRVNDGGYNQNGVVETVPARGESSGSRQHLRVRDSDATSSIDPFR